MSEDTARQIDEEVRRIIDEAETKARQVLTDHIDELHKLTDALLEYETLSGAEVARVLNDEPPQSPSGPDNGGTAVTHIPHAGGKKRDDKSGGMEPQAT